MATYYIQTIELKLKISHQSAVEWRTCEDSVKCKQNLEGKRLEGVCFKIGPSVDDQAVSLSDDGTTIIIDFFSFGPSVCVRHRRLSDTMVPL